MKPVKFKEQNVIFGAKQKEYKPLNAFQADDKEGGVVTCWTGNLFERIIFLFTGKIWFITMTFNQPLQPQTLTVRKKNIFFNKAPQKKSLIIQSGNS